MNEYAICIKGQTDAIYHIEAPHTEGYVLGRADSGSHYTPDLDFAPYAAREHGVSRRHAALIVYQGRTHLIDLNSVNGTYVNGKRLPPEQPHPISADQMVRLGTLELRITEA